MYAIFLILILLVDTCCTAYFVALYRGLRRDVEDLRRDLSRAGAVGTVDGVPLGSVPDGVPELDLSALADALAKHGLAGGDLVNVGGDDE